MAGKLLTVPYISCVALRTRLLLEPDLGGAPCGSSLHLKELGEEFEERAKFCVAKILLISWVFGHQFGHGSRSEYGALGSQDAFERLRVFFSSPRFFDSTALDPASRTLMAVLALESGTGLARVMECVLPLLSRTLLPSMASTSRTSPEYCGRSPLRLTSSRPMYVLKPPCSRMLFWF